MLHHLSEPQEAAPSPSNLSFVWVPFIHPRLFMDLHFHHCKPSLTIFNDFLLQIPPHFVTFCLLNK